MIWFKPLLIALALMLLDPLAVVLVPIALIFARWDLAPSADSMGAGPGVIRGDLPRWASWLGTPNERLPGGTYEPTVFKVLARFGRFLCAWYWLGVRNRLYGLQATFGVPISGPWPGDPGYYRNGDIWWLRKPIFSGRLQFKAGYRTYFINGAWLAVPCCSITKP